MTSLVLPVLGVIAAVLAVTIVMEVKGSHRPVEVPPIAASIGIPKGARVADFDETEDWPKWVGTSLARPLFEPDRRPPAVAVGAVSHQMPRLAGIIVTPTARSAIFVDGASGRPIIVMQGSRLSDFVVRSIDAETVTIVTADGVRVLHPRFATTKLTTQSGNSGLPSAYGSPAFPPPLAFLPQAGISSHDVPFAGIPGLSGLPLGLVATPDQGGPAAGAAPDLSPDLPLRAPSESSP
ncbi:hypothetical protein [Acidisoma cladoniae]|jgi:hypothetical protein|uniref:hypothetical protein n=1 Tax=Acidisoma cladoniae TaxID=3040935 RepID=UPI00254B6BFE|nr:hypothetical protein [Acidisoma sp. PAMC 29798]